MKKAFLITMAMAFIGLADAQSQVYKTVRVDTAGMLDTLLSAEELASITDLTLTGTINLDDYNTMKTLMPALKVIDLGSVQTSGDSIPGEAFKTDITSLILPSSITKVGNRALYPCPSLTTLSIPPLVTRIGELAFADCAGLTSVTLPESVRTIGNLAFAGCRSLSFIDLPDSLNYLGQHVFVVCDSMTTIAIPPGIKILGAHTFEGCGWLDSISFGSSVVSIGSFAFAGCNNLRSIIIPASVDSIAQYAFVGCPGLTSVTILSSSETSIGDYAFAGDAKLTSVTILHSDGISLGKYVFVACTNLKTLNMAAWSVTSIGEGCFINTIIDSLVFPSSLTSIGKDAFINNDSLRSVTFLPSSGTSVGEMAFIDCSNLVSVRMCSPSVDSIGLNCFRQCVSLYRITIPSSLTYVGDYAFIDCHLTGTLTMPSSLTHIGERAFFSQPIDTLIFLPSSGTSLGDYSFALCPNLTSITMYSSSVDTLGQRCFSDCPNLRNVVLPASLASIQYGAFGWDYDLQWFRINSLIPPVLTASNVFPYWSGGTIDLYVPAGTKEAYQAAVFWSGFNIIEYDLHLSANRDTLMIADTTASTVAFEITSSVNWKVSPDQPWLTADPNLGIDTALITLIAEENPDTVTREAVVTLSGVNVPLQTIVVIQDPMPVLLVSDPTMDIGWQESSTANFRIISNQEWTLHSGQSWLEASLQSGSKSHEILLTAEANHDTIPREAAITVYTGRLYPQTIIVTQAPASVLAVTPSELDIGSQEGSTAQFNIASNAVWTVQSSQSWLAMSSTAGNGNRDIILTAASNPEFALRDAVITVSADGVPAQTITVTQEAAIPSGSKDLSKDAIGIYPNPIQNVLHIDHAAGCEMILLDTQGTIILSQKLSGDHETIDLSFLSPGEYLIKIANEIVKVVKYL
jgi:hypothetical protein